MENELNCLFELSDDELAQGLIEGRINLKGVEWGRKRAIVVILRSIGQNMDNPNQDKANLIARWLEEEMNAELHLFD